jgi:hypothetical protein
MRFRTIDQIAHGIEDISGNGHCIGHKTLMPKAKNQIKPKKSGKDRGDKGVGSNLNSDAASRKNLTADAALRREVGEFIRAMAVELAALAYLNNLDALAIACDVVREVAEGNVNSHQRHVDYTPTL